MCPSWKWKYASARSGGLEAAAACAGAAAGWACAAAGRSAAERSKAVEQRQQAKPRRGQERASCAEFSCSPGQRYLDARRHTAGAFSILGYAAARDGYGGTGSQRFCVPRLRIPAAGSAASAWRGPKRTSAGVPSLISIRGRPATLPALPPGESHAGPRNWSDTCPCNRKCSSGDRPPARRRRRAILPAKDTPANRRR